MMKGDDYSEYFYNDPECHLLPYFSFRWCLTDINKLANSDLFDKHSNAGNFHTLIRGSHGDPLFHLLFSKHSNFPSFPFTEFINRYWLQCALKQQYFLLQDKWEELVLACHCKIERKTSLHLAPSEDLCWGPGLDVYRISQLGLPPALLIACVGTSHGKEFFKCWISSSWLLQHPLDMSLLQAENSETKMR